MQQRQEAGEVLARVGGRYYLVNETAAALIQLLETAGDLANVDPLKIEEVASQWGASVEVVGEWLRTTAAELSADRDHVHGRGLDFGAPIKVQWRVLKQCNLECKHCLVSSSPRDTRPHLSREDAIALCDKLLEARIFEVTFSGGEPFMCGWLCEIIERFLRAGTSVKVFTNGTLLHKFHRQLKRFSAWPFSLTVSLDGVEADHDRMRGSGSFKRTLKGIRSAQAAGVPVEASCVINGYNVARLVGLVDVAQELQLQRLQFTHLMRVGRATEYYNELAVAPDLLDSFERALEERLNRAVLLPTGEPRVLYARSRGAGPVKVVDASTPEGRVVQEDWACCAGRTRITIEEDGTVFGCPLIKGLPLGNLHKESVTDVWAGDRRSRYLAYVQQRNQGRLCAGLKETMEP